MLLVLDNHDSFTFNLVQALGALGAELTVRTSDALTLTQVQAMQPAAILISPGPGRPQDAGVSTEVVRNLGPTVPILGVCLGHQVICEALGARVVHAPRLLHGRTSEVVHDARGVFSELPSPLTAARYHSLVVDESTLPDCLEPCAWADSGELMAVRHRVWPMHGVQFHPESFLTELGPRLLANFLRIVEGLVAPSVGAFVHG